jgi:hypothetical protein
MSHRPLSVIKISMHSFQYVGVIRVTLRLCLGYGKQPELQEFLGKADEKRQGRAISRFAFTMPALSRLLHPKMVNFSVLQCPLMAVTSPWAGKLVNDCY